MDPLSLLWLFIILASLQPVFQRQLLAGRRQRRLATISRRRGATVITLIHRQETMSLLGFPIVRYIDIDDAESMLRIRATHDDRPIELDNYRRPSRRLRRLRPGAEHDSGHRQREPRCARRPGPSTAQTAA